ncbi:hypothetical protein F422_gp017 [Staphylococcus phage SA11]|uniref:Uncharacterized protein n=1 Tax=Staphylococcus phage SA11 TaxID=2927988 RepID=I7CCJ3_9CAUD|nr:hypothetical protein F422_gp017 [Staphylococcus phage SA11]AFO70604.1 hypothetical protein [Staphylococcus phage SA11]WCO82472.1 hypothetical protein PBSA08_117 [Staphylococcus phage PBSA08]WJZ48675.1 hypothetical protein SAC_44 [Staphylococcus phage SAC]
MYTNEFIKKVNNLGYETSLANKNTTKRKEKILIKKENQQPIAWVFLNEPYSFRSLGTDSELFDLMVEYAKTPVKERSISNIAKVKPLDLDTLTDDYAKVREFMLKVLIDMEDVVEYIQYTGYNKNIINQWTDGQTFRAIDKQGYNSLFINATSGIEKVLHGNYIIKDKKKGFEQVDRELFEYRYDMSH